MLLWLMSIVSLLLPAVMFSNPHTENSSLRALALIEHVKTCIEKAECEFSSLSISTLLMNGMSSAKVRHLLNNLCSLSQTSYLEIGCWKGSTLVAALYNNNPSVIQAVAIDNWSEFDGPRDIFFSNIHNFLENSPLRVVEADCFSVNKEAIFSKPINIYFYDGNHSVINQEMAFTYFNDILDDIFITVIDDWNGASVQEGTRSAFDKLHYEILFEEELYTPQRQNFDVLSWWNGIYIAVIKKDHLCTSPRQSKC